MDSLAMSRVLDQASAMIGSLELIMNETLKAVTFPRIATRHLAEVKDMVDRLSKLIGDAKDKRDAEENEMLDDLERDFIKRERIRNKPVDKIG